MSYSKVELDVIGYCKVNTGTYNIKAIIYIMNYKEN